VQQVGDNASNDDHHGPHQDSANHDGVVSRRNSDCCEIAHSRPREDPLDQHGTADERR